MKAEAKSVEELIAAVLDDINQKGYSSVMPFSIGSVEVRMSQFADANGIELASRELYMSAKQLQHSMRASKNAKGLVVQSDRAVYLSEGNQAARSNCSSSRRCHRSAHRGSTWLLLSRCKDKHFSLIIQINHLFFADFSPQRP